MEGLPQVLAGLLLAVRSYIESPSRWETLALQGLPFACVRLRTEELDLCTASLCNLAGNAFNGFACLTVVTAMLATVNLDFERSPAPVIVPETAGPSEPESAAQPAQPAFSFDLLIDVAMSSQGDSLFADSQP